MKLVANEGGRILDRISIDELRPPGGVFVPDLFRAIVERYQFAVLPNGNIGEALKDGAKFEHGKAIIGGKTLVVKELAMYSDGLISDAFDTDSAELILDDFIAWATAEFKLKERQSPSSRTYTSAVVIKFEKDLEPALGKMAKVRTLLSDALKSNHGWDYTYSTSRLMFSVDPQSMPPYRNTNFILEKRAQVPFSENRYFSAAPFRTEEHLRLLETIEKELL